MNEWRENKQEVEVFVDVVGDEAVEATPLQSPYSAVDSMLCAAAADTSSPVFSQSSSGNNNEKKSSFCGRCQNHSKLAEWNNGHKAKCPYKDCDCDPCQLLTKKRREVTRPIAAKCKEMLSSVEKRDPDGKTVHYCRKCMVHGEISLSKGHKQACEQKWRDCKCEKCQNIFESRKNAAESQKHRRRQKRQYDRTNAEGGNCEEDGGGTRGGGTFAPSSSLTSLVYQQIRKEGVQTLEAAPEGSPYSTVINNSSVGNNEFYYRGNSSILQQQLQQLIAQNNINSNNMNQTFFSLPPAGTMAMNGTEILNNLLLQHHQQQSNLFAAQQQQQLLSQLGTLWSMGQLQNLDHQNRILAAAAAAASTAGPAAASNTGINNIPPALIALLEALISNSNQ